MTVEQDMKCNKCKNEFSGVPNQAICNECLNTSNKKTSTRTSTRIDWYIQSAVYLVTAGFWQAENAMRQGIELPLEEHFFIALISFGIPSWLLISGIMYLIERNKPEEERSNTLFWMGLGFLGIIVFI